MIGGDTLTCGVCQKDFALADIVKFIQHKVLTCNKENHPCKSKSSSSATNENGSGNAAESDEESNNNSADADKTALENGEKRKDDDGEMMDDGDKRAGEDEAEGASSSSDKENSTAEAAAADSEGEAKADPKSSPGLTSSAKSPSSPVTSTPDSSARKRKAAFVDADTNTIITGKQARKEGRSPRRKEGRKRRGVEPWGKFAGSSSRQHSQRRPRPRGVPACLPPPSSAVTFGFLCGSDFLHSRPLFFFFVYSSSSDDDLHLR